MTLTARRRRILGAIASHPRPGAPTYREIGIVAGLSSVSSVRHQLLRLQRDGWLWWDSTRPGSLRLADGVVVWRSAVGVEPCATCGLTLPTDHHHAADLAVSLHEVAAKVEPAESLEDLRARLNTPREDTTL